MSTWWFIMANSARKSRCGNGLWCDFIRDGVLGPWITGENLDLFSEPLRICVHDMDLIQVNNHSNHMLFLVALRWIFHYMNHRTSHSRRWLPILHFYTRHLPRSSLLSSLNRSRRMPRGCWYCLGNRYTALTPWRQLPNLLSELKALKLLKPAASICLFLETNLRMFR